MNKLIRVIPILVGLTLALSSLSWGQGAVPDPETLFRWSGQVVPDTASRGSRTEIRLMLSLPEDHLVYRDQTSISFEAESDLRISEAAFPASSLKVDPITGKEVDAFTGAPVFTFVSTVTVPSGARPGRIPVKANIRYQGCSPTLCYFPTTKTLELALTVVEAADRSDPGALTVAQLEDFSREGEGLLGKGMVWALLLAFIGGLLTSLTPCVYPLIPITISIFGARKVKSRWESLLLSCIYVLGIASTYSVLGLSAASTGAVFGQVLTNPWVIGGVVAILAAFGVSMLGAFEIRLPSVLQEQLTAVGGHGYVGAFGMGLVGGIIAAPCTGPVLAGVLTYVATTQDMILGFWLLFSFALGLGVLFIVIGTFSSALSSLPRSGTWMEGVKSLLGIMMLAAALFFFKDIAPWLKSFLDRSAGTFAAAGGLIVLGLILGAVHKSFHGSSKGVRLRKGIGVGLCAVGLYVVAGAFTVTALEAGPDWVLDEKEGFEKAHREGKPAMIDFYADWCAACVELDRETYSHPEVRERLKGFISIKLDFTNDSEGTRAIQKKYRIVGLPTIVFFDRDGKELSHKRLTGFISAEKFLSHIEGMEMENEK